MIRLQNLIQLDNLKYGHKKYKNAGFTEEIKLDGKLKFLSFRCGDTFVIVNAWAEIRADIYIWIYSSQVNSSVGKIHILRSLDQSSPY